jgi:HAE1 family hydrophobic/amphiphilic exporter-1
LGSGGFVFGAGQYALRVWVDPNKLAALNITTPEIERAISAQNTVNPAGQVGGEPIPPGQAFTNTVLAQGRLVTEQQFANIVIRAEPNGAFVRIRDVGRVELGSQTYSMTSTFNGKPAAVLAIYQLPGSNAVDAAKGVRQLMTQLKDRFPSGITYSIALDTTLAVTAGMEEIYKTLPKPCCSLSWWFSFFAKVCERLSYLCSPCRYRWSAPFPCFLC